MRQPLVAGNWKMHGSRESVGVLLVELLAGDIADTVEVAVCPTYVHLVQALELCAGTSIGVGAQDCSHVESGAYTGEVAASMLADLGCGWVILGHSERRAYHNESDSLISAKLAAAIEAGLKPVLCVGETREQRESGEAQGVVAAQLAGALNGHARLDGLVIAYEPVWAIGTGKTASSEQAQEMHDNIRRHIAAEGFNSDVPILYGGSCKPSNAKELFACPDVNGGLIGGASLKDQDFLAIANAFS